MHPSLVIYKAFDSSLGEPYPGKFFPYAACIQVRLVGWHCCEAEGFLVLDMLNVFFFSS
jgi:hypothetical protein